MTTVVFVDTETTRLDDDGEVWEIGAIVREPDHPDVRHRYLVRPQRMHLADPEALAIGRFHERTDHITEVLRGAVANLAEPGVPEAWSCPATLAALLEGMFDGAVLTASNAPFDHRKLALFLARFECELNAHYRPVDSGGVSWGYLHGRAAAGRVTPQQRAVLARGLPWSSTDVAAALGVHRQNVHEALPDAEFVRDVHDLVTGWTPAFSVGTPAVRLDDFPLIRDDLIRATLDLLTVTYAEPRIGDEEDGRYADERLIDAARQLVAAADARPNRGGA
jgi:DNA polymerase III epsilon subunit-like protein